jgi:H+/Cl- antiporter ClcA
VNKTTHNLKHTLGLFFKWLFISLSIGGLIGSAGALFLWSLQFVTDTREENLWIVLLLPIAGLLIGWGYYKQGKGIEKGNNLLIDEFHAPKKTIPFKMAPMVLIGTLLTHLGGGSAGREGTALQIGASIADQFNRFFKLHSIQRKTLIILGMSGGFAAVFGTPIAGAIFSLEVLRTKKIHPFFILPTVFVAFVSDYVCHAWGVAHTQYYIGEVAAISVFSISWAALAGVCFGLTARLFSQQKKFWKKIATRLIPLEPVRPFIGGIVIVVIVFVMGTSKYIGLGVPIIEAAFSYELQPYDFMIKLLLTAFTLGVGFKGGEVTPLFFMGATLGNALFWIIPLPMGLLAGMGFVAVFAGATNTPIACAVMGMELFGIEGVLFFAIACFTAFLCSGKTSVYSAQNLTNKYKLF